MSLLLLRVCTATCADGWVLQLPHAAVECKKCHARDAVFFQSQQRTPETGMVRVLSSFNTFGLLKNSRHFSTFAANAENSGLR